MNKLVKSVNKNDLVTEFLISLNGILRLTDRELELMAELIRLDLNYNKQPNENKNIANRANRKHIINTLGITKDNLSRYIKSFKQISPVCIFIGKKAVEHTHIKGFAKTSWTCDQRNIIPVVPPLPYEICLINVEALTFS